MKFMWKAACAAVLLVAATSIEIGCGGTYRPIATPAPITTANPAGFETAVVLNRSSDGTGVLTEIDVSGDSNAGNKVLQNSPTSIAFDNNRSSIYAANTTTDSVTQVLLANSTNGFAATTNTISLDTGAAPIGVSFEYFGGKYTTDYIINSGNSTGTLPPVGTANCPGTGSLTALTQLTAQTSGNVCVGINPVFAWIYTDQTKVFVLDKSENQVYVVSAGKLKVTNKIPLGAGAAPIKATQSANGQFIYVLNSGNGTISVIDGQTETVATVPTGNVVTSSLPIDIVQTPAPNDGTTNTQVNHLWILHADGTVSVFDATVPGTLTWITSLATGANPTNLALMRDGSRAYVGLGGTDQIAVIDTSKLVSGLPTTGATTTVTVGVHRSIGKTTFTDENGVTRMASETTTPLVNFVAVSRGTNTSDTSKAYATTITNTTYNYFDAAGAPEAPPSPIPANCSALGNALTCPNLYNGTSVVTAAGSGTTPINTMVTTVPAPSIVTHCDPGNPAIGGTFDGQKNCPVMSPLTILGSS